MKGKKINYDFINQFFENCISNQITDSKEMLNKALSQISEIDSKIKEAEELKKIRVNLTDVIQILSQEEDKPNIDNKILKLFEIPNKNICNFICNKINKEPVDICNFKDHKFNDTDIIFTIKKLIENKVVYKQGNYILRGSMYDTYLRSVAGL